MFAALPVAAVQEMNVMSRAFSTEFGWTSGAAINIVTKSGTNRMRGDALILGRPGGPQPSSLGTGAQCPSSISSCVAPTANGAAAPIVPPNTPDSLVQGSGSIGGAITPDRTYYFVAADFTRQNRTAPITTPLALPGTTFVGSYRQALLFARMDHKLSSAQTLMARINLDRLSDTNPEDTVSGNVLPSAARRFSRHARGFQVNDTFILSSRMVNEARLEYHSANPITAFEPVSPSTQFTRAGAVPFTSGESRSVHVFSRIAQLSDTFTWILDQHDVRVGGNFTRNVSGGDGTEFGNAFVRGQYTVKSTSTALPDQLTLADMQSYLQSFNLGVSTYETPQSLFAVFAQDSYRARDDNHRVSPDSRSPELRRQRRQLHASDRRGVESVRRSEDGRPRRVRLLLHAAAIELRGELRAQRTAGHLHLSGLARPARFPDVSDVHAGDGHRQSDDREDVARAHYHGPARSRLLLLAVLHDRAAPALLERDVRESAEPGRVDRRRARGAAAAVRLRRLRETALDRARPLD
jgi:hypothetical protein